MRDFLLREDGATLAEYALLLAILGVVIGLGVYTLGVAIADSMEASSEQIAAD